MRIPLVQRLDLVRLAIDYDARDASQLPRSIDAIGRAPRLVAKPHIIRVLVVERHPLWFAGAVDAREGDFAVVAVDARDDDAVAGERGFLLEGIAGRCRVFAVVGFPFDGGDFAGFDVEVVDIVPFYFERLFLLVDGDGEPDVARLPE